MSLKKQKLSSKQGIAYELHKPARKNYLRRKTTIKGLYDLMQIDLVEMQQFASLNNGYRYILMAINALSKYAFAEPLKTKSAAEVAQAMEKIIKKSNHAYSNLQSDMGKEFWNSTFKTLMDKYKINHYHTFSPIKAAIVERLNRTIKNLMYREFSARGSYKWVGLLQELIHFYNNRVHRATGKKPSQVTLKDEKFLLERLKGSHSVPRLPDKFKIGDKVRISKAKMIFSKGYTPSWTTEIFTVDSVMPTVPTTYLLKDWLGEPIKGSFYKEELSKTNYPDTYLVEKILRYSKDRKKAYVKFLGFPTPSWINSSEIE